MQPMNEPTDDQLRKLWEHCRSFVKEQAITCPEMVHDCDHVMENAPRFIKQVAAIVGYEDPV